MASIGKFALALACALVAFVVVLPETRSFTVLAAGSDTDPLALPSEQVLRGAFYSAKKNESTGDLKWTRLKQRRRILDEHLAFDADRRMNGQQLRTLAKSVPNLYRLDLSGCVELVDRDVALLNAFEHLVELDVTFCTGITDAGYATLKPFKKLKRFESKHKAFIKDRGIDALAKSETLEVVKLGALASISDRFFFSLARLKKLRELEITGMDANCKISDAGLICIGAFEELERLHLGNFFVWDREEGKPRENGEWLATLLGLEFLVDLHVQWPREGKNLAPLSVMTQLERLTLAGLPPWDPASGLRHLWALENLHYLDLGSHHSLDKDVATALEKLESLETLKANQCYIYRDAVVALAKLPKFRELHVTNTLNTEISALVKLQSVKGLERLVLSDTLTLSTDLLQALALVESLEELDLSQTLINDDVLETFAILPKLKRISVKLCADISDEGVARFKKLRSKCEVIR